MEVRLYGIVAEQAGADLLQLEASNTTELISKLKEHVKDLDQLSYTIAVQRELVHEEIALQGNEEIAILPPFAGG